MQTIEIQLYEYEDIIKPENEIVLKQVLANYEVYDSYIYTEYEETRQKFLEIFPNTNDLRILHLKGKRLLSYFYSKYDQITSKKYYSLNGVGANNYKSRYSSFQTDELNCPLTGMTFDNDVLEPIFNLWGNPDFDKTYEDVINECFNQLRESYNSQIDYLHSEQGILEDIQANNAVFDVHGTQY